AQRHGRPAVARELAQMDPLVAQGEVAVAGAAGLPAPIDVDGAADRGHVVIEVGALAAQREDPERAPDQPLQPGRLLGQQAEARELGADLVEQLADALLVAHTPGYASTPES